MRWHTSTLLATLTDHNLRNRKLVTNAPVRIMAITSFKLRNFELAEFYNRTTDGSLLFMNN